MFSKVLTGTFVSALSLIFLGFSPDIRAETVLFQSLSDKGKRYYYRIPSLVVINKSKTVVAFAEQRVGSNADSGDINVVYRISHDHGQSWSRIFRICELQKNTCGNPTAVVDQKTGKIHLFMMSNPGNKAQRHETKPPFGVGDRRVRYLTAKVNKRGVLSFSPLRDFTRHLQPSGTAMDVIGPGVGIQLTQSRYKGRLVIPAAHRTFISDNHGRTWRMSRSIMPKTSSESAIVELDDGTIFRNDRSMGANRCKKDENGKLLPGSPKCRRSVSWSENGGDYFTDPSINHRLFDPIAQGSMLRYAPGHIFFANCASTEKRRYMTIQKTLDGKKWFAAKRIDKSCGYSSMAKTRDYHVAILYERRRHSRYRNPKANPLDLVFKKFKLREFK